MNFDKSRIFFSNHTAREVKAKVGKLTNIPSTNEFEKYFRFNMFMDGRGNHNYRYVLDKMRNKLSTWKAKTLSFAGRVTLVKLVLSSLPTYHMQIMRFSKYSCEEMDQICRDFLWQEGDPSRKIHLVEWNSVCKQKRFGGPGI